MKLWLMKPVDGCIINDPWRPWYDCAFGFVVRAADERAARKIAAQECGAEGDRAWLNEKRSSCIELLPEGEPGLILRDFASA